MNTPHPSTGAEQGQTAEGFWDQKYAERPQIWSGNANGALVDTMTDQPPGRALDLGCGEGGDSIWLAQNGWTVTGLDISSTALARAREAAEVRGVNDQITWAHEDLSEWQPEEEFHLISAIFLQSPIDFPREQILAGLSTNVTPGGHLLIVGHAEFPPWSRHADDDDEKPPSATELWQALELPAEDWNLVICEEREREATGPDGEKATLVDSVVLAQRKSRDNNK